MEVLLLGTKVFFGRGGSAGGWCSRARRCGPRRVVWGFRVRRTSGLREGADPVLCGFIGAFWGWLGVLWSGVLWFGRLWVGVLWRKSPRLSRGVVWPMLWDLRRSGISSGAWAGVCFGVWRSASRMILRARLFEEQTSRALPVSSEVRLSGVGELLSSPVGSVGGDWVSVWRILPGPGSVRAASPGRRGRSWRELVSLLPRVFSAWPVWAAPFEEVLVGEALVEEALVGEAPRWAELGVAERISRCFFCRIWCQRGLG